MNLFGGMKRTILKFFLIQYIYLILILKLIRIEFQVCTKQVKKNSYFKPYKMFQHKHSLKYHL